MYTETLDNKHNICKNTVCNWFHQWKYIQMENIWRIPGCFIEYLPYQKIMLLKTAFLMT